MRILYLGNNRLGLDVLKWLRGQGESVKGLVIHPAEKSSLAEDIREAAAVPAESVFIGSSLQEAPVLDAIQALKPDIALSVNFGYLLRPPLIQLVGGNAINLHTGYLPHNRGAHPNVWSIIEGTPAGATLHYIDAGIDTGDIIAQQQVTVEPVDTGMTLYRKLEDAAVSLFRRTWPVIRGGSPPRYPQPRATGSYHKVADLSSIDEIDLSRQYLARDLINLLRARTFPPHESAYFMVDGRRVSIRVDLSYAPRGEGSAGALDLDSPEFTGGGRGNGGD